MYLFKLVFLFSLDISPGMGLLNYAVVVFLGLFIFAMPHGLQDLIP